MRDITDNGKPMRALQILKDAEGAMYEMDVWRCARVDSPNDTQAWHAPLNKLVALGFAERTGSRGGYRYQITSAGVGRVFASKEKDR